MKHKSRQIKSNMLLSVAIALTGVFISGNALAINDVIHTVATKLGHGLTYGKLVKQVDEAKKTYENLQKNLIKVQGLQSSGIAMTDKFEQRDPQYGMKAACPGAGAFSLSNLMSSMALDMEGDIKKQQKEICQRIVMAHNVQYNESAKMLKHLREVQGAKLKAIEKEVNGVGDSKGKLDSAVVKFDQYQADATRDEQYSTTLIAAYDTYIESLQQSQALLGKQALTGNNGSDTFAETVTRKFVQGAVLKGSLDTLRATRDR